ncbi:kinetochore protein spc25 [Penicillium herquei]|nr:kinetochore protein spc25 [Penicillium herquei]
MTSSFEPSLSTSGMRPPLASADAPSMADSLPNINFGFEDLRNRMAHFTAKFDAFIERGRKQVLEERNQFHINLAELQVTMERDSRLTKRDRLKQQIAETQKAINQRLEAQKAHAKQLDAQSRLNNPELEFWQDYLCLRIEGAGRDDRLKFVYSHIVEKDWETEAWFELGTASRDYEVFHTRPKVDRDALEREVELVNEDRDFGAFLKRMRKLFVETMN